MKKLINTEILCWNRCFYTRFSFSDGSFEWYSPANANINSYPENDHNSQLLEKEYQKMVNKPVETTNEQPKPATSSCGSEGCDHYKYDHICRCQ